MTEHREIDYFPFRLKLSYQWWTKRIPEDEENLEYWCFDSTEIDWCFFLELFFFTNPDFNIKKSPQFNSNLIKFRLGILTIGEGILFRVREFFSHSFWIEDKQLLKPFSSLGSCMFRGRKSTWNKNISLTMNRGRNGNNSTKNNNVGERKRKLKTAARECLKNTKTHLATQGLN